MLFFSSESSDHSKYKFNYKSVLFERSNVMMYQSTIDPKLKNDIKQDFIHRNNSWAFVDDLLRDYAAVFFDMDGTIISQESSVELSETILTPTVKKQISDLTKDAMEGKIDFKTSLAKRVSKFKGINKSVLNELTSRLTLNPGIEELISHFYFLGVQCYLVTGGLSTLATPIAKKLGMSGVCANTPEMKYLSDYSDNDYKKNEKDQDNWVMTGALTGPVIDELAKAEYVKKVCKKLQIDLDQTIAVGDGANDVEMAKIVGLSVGYYPKWVLKNHLDAVNNSGNHLFIMDLLDHSQNLMSRT